MLSTSGLAVDVRRPLLDDGLAVDAHRPPDILCSKLSNAGFQTFQIPYPHLSNIHTAVPGSVNTSWPVI